VCERVAGAQRGASKLDHFVLFHRCMPVPFPHRHSATLSRSFASRVMIEAPPRPTLHGGPSPERDGDDARSPEHMLLCSLGLCMLTTFEAFAVRDGIEVLAWDAKVGGTVEQTPEGRMFTSIVLELDMELDGNIDMLEPALEDAKRCCLVLNSLRVPVVIETTLRTPGDVLDNMPRPHPSASPAPREAARREAGRRESRELCQAS